MLTRFPSELLLATLLFLDQGDVAAVSATCQALRAAVKPILYRDIRLVFPKDFGPRPASCDWRAAALLRTLVTDAATGKLVRRFEMSCPTSYRLTNHQSPRATLEGLWSETDLILIKQALKGMHLSDRPSWEKHLLRHDVTAVVAMIIWHCPDLRSVNVNERYLFANGLALDMLANAIPEGRFNGLKGLISPFPYRWRRAEYQHPLQFLVFFYLPSLEALDFALPHPTHADREALRAKPLPAQHWPLVAMAAPVALRLTRLRLGLKDTLHDVVPLVLSWTPNLKHLYLYYELDDATPPLNMERLHRGLGLLAGTLETLVIRLQLFITQNNDDPLEGTLGSLRSLTSLKSLDLSLGMFFDRSLATPAGHPCLSLAEILPPNLEYLTVSDDIGHVYRDYHPLWEWGAAKALMHFLAGARLAGAWRRGRNPLATPLEYTAFNADTPAADYGENEGKWMRADWQGEATEPEWRTATPRLRALEVVRFVSCYLIDHTPLSRRLRDDLADACAAQGLAFYNMGAPAPRGHWLVDQGYPAWPLSSTRVALP